MIRLLILFFISLLALSCNSKKELISEKKSLVNQLNSEINTQHHIGFLLKDLDNHKVVFEHNADKNFTAASNIKLLNFFVGLNMLGDSVPSFKYTIAGDSLLVWPMADPTFLHPHFKSQKAFDFLKNSGKNIFIVSGGYKGEKYGRGWAWDDYNESYQTEITEFPIYGNVISCSLDSAGKLKMSPDLSSLFFADVSVNKSALALKRNIYSNNIDVPEVFKTGFKQNIPISFTNNVLESLLSDTLLATGLITSSVAILPYRDLPASAKTVYSVSTKEVFQKMLKDSDNFIAEQLLLNYAAANNLEMSKESVFAKANEFLPELRSSLQWVDGSGLSRLNIVSPSLMVSVLEKIKIKVNDDKNLFSYLPAGGKSGTIRNMFTTSPQTFIYAKSGSLSNNYNLSGYLVGKSGKQYAFSYLNNNYLKLTKDIKVEVERLLTYIYEHY